MSLPPMLSVSEKAGHPMMIGQLLPIPVVKIKKQLMIAHKPLFTVNLFLILLCFFVLSSGFPCLPAVSLLSAGCTAVHGVRAH